MLEIKEYLDKTVDALNADAKAKGLKIPELTVVETPEGGQVWANGYIWYLVFGRKPGKFPPPDKMTKFVQEHPEVLQDAKQKWKGVNERSLGYLIGRKIAKVGTDIYQGKRPGLDILGSMEKNLPELTAKIARNEAIKILTFLKSGVAVLILCTCCTVVKPVEYYSLEKKAELENVDAVIRKDYGYWVEETVVGKQVEETPVNWLFVGVFVLTGIILWQQE